MGRDNIQKNIQTEKHKKQEKNIKRENLEKHKIFNQNINKQQNT